MSENPIRVALCDDHAMVRDALGLVLEHEPDIDVVGSVATSNEMLQLIGTQRPDVAILDLRLAEESGVDLAQRIRSTHPDCRIVMLTAAESDLALVNSHSAGASAFLMKTGDFGALVSAVRRVASGEHLIDSLSVREATRRLRMNGASVIAELDDTDRQILKLIAAGHSDKQIAESVYLSLQTVRNRVSRLLNRFGKENRTQLAVFIAQILPELGG